MSRSAPPPLPANLGTVLEFMRALWALEDALETRSRGLNARFGVTGSQRLAVRIVGQSPGISAGQVAAVLHVDPSTLTPVLQRLLERGLIRREVDPEDRRRAILFLTARGERVDEVSAATVDRAIRGALARMAPSEVFSARRVLRAITEGLAQQRPAAAGAPTEGRRTRAARAPRARRRLPPRDGA